MHFDWSLTIIPFRLGDDAEVGDAQIALDLVGVAHPVGQHRFRVRQHATAELEIALYALAAGARGGALRREKTRVHGHWSLGLLTRLVTGLGRRTIANVRRHEERHVAQVVQGAVEFRRFLIAREQRWLGRGVRRR